MACGCSKNKTVVNQNQPLVAPNNQLFDRATDPNFVKVIYNGPDYPHLIGSPTGIIAQFGMMDYGMGKKGIEFYVHRNDLQKSPFLYTVIPTVQEDVQPVAQIEPTEIKEVTKTKKK